MKIWPTIPLYTTIAMLWWACSGESTKDKKEMPKREGNMVFREVPVWMGSYQDTLPCVDCLGMLTRIDLNSDSSYKKSVILLGKEPVFENTFSTKGKWNFDNKTRMLTLTPDNKEKAQVFELSGDSLLKLTDDKGLPYSTPNMWLPKVL